MGQLRTVRRDSSGQRAGQLSTMQNCLPQNVASSALSNVGERFILAPYLCSEDPASVSPGPSREKDRPSTHWSTGHGEQEWVRTDAASVSEP